MPVPDLIRLFVVPFNTLDITYMVTGAVAAVVYGEPRLTRDIDVVMELRRGDAHRLAAAFPEAEFYVPPVETMDEEARRPSHGHFNLIHGNTGLKADCYLVGTDPFQEWGIDRRVRHDVEGVSVWVAPLEYVIVRKLEWYRDGASDRHLDDIRAMLRVSGATVDRRLLAEWISRLKVEEQWRAIVGTASA